MWVTEGCRSPACVTSGDCYRGDGGPLGPADKGHRRTPLSHVQAQEVRGQARPETNGDIFAGRRAPAEAPGCEVKVQRATPAATLRACDYSHAKVHFLILAPVVLTPSQFGSASYIFEGSCNWQETDLTTT